MARSEVTSGPPVGRVPVCGAPGGSRVFVAFALLASAAAPASDWQLSEEELDRLAGGEIVVHAEIDAPPMRAKVRAAVKIDAPPELIFRTMTDCAQALQFVPHLETCKVLESAPDGSWQLVEHVADYSWLLRSKHYVFRADYTPFEQVRFTYVRGDFSDSEGVWQLLPADDGGGTIVQYRMTATPKFYVPRWLLRAILRRDLPELMTGLRERCERAEPGSAAW